MKNIEAHSEQDRWGLKETSNYIRQNLKIDYSNYNEIFEYLLSRKDMDEKKIILMLNMVKKENYEKHIEYVINQHILSGKSDITVVKLLANEYGMGLLEAKRLIDKYKK